MSDILLNKYRKTVRKTLFNCGRYLDSFFYRAPKAALDFYWPAYSAPEIADCYIEPDKPSYNEVIRFVCCLIGSDRQNGKLYDVWEAHKPILSKPADYLIRKLLWNFSQLGPDKFYSWYKTAAKYLKKCYDNHKVTELHYLEY